VSVESGRTASVLASLKWSRRRKIAVVTAGAGIAAALAGLVTGLLAVGEDAALGASTRLTNPDRQAWRDRLARRDRYATSATILLSGAAVALVAAGILYWFDRPEAPVGAVGGRGR
jgi:hypothetical protein